MVRNDLSAKRVPGAVGRDVARVVALEVALVPAVDGIVFQASGARLRIAGIGAWAAAARFVTRRC